MDSEQAAKPRVVVAEDSAEMLQLIKRILRSKFDVIGATQEGKAAVSLVLELEPDILIIDVAMPGLNGIDAAAILNRERSSTKVIFLSTFDEPDLIEAALRVGGKAVILKSYIHLHLPEAIAAVMEGRIFSSSEPS